MSLNVRTAVPLLVTFPMVPVAAFLTLALAPRTEVAWGYRLARAGHPTSSGFAAGAPSPRPLARCCTGAFRAAKLLAIAHGAMCVALRTRGSARWCCVLRLASQQQVTRFGSRHQVNAESNFGIRLSTRSFDKLAQVPLPIARPMILAATALPHAPTPRTEVLGPFELIRGAPTNSTHTCFSPA